MAGTFPKTCACKGSPGRLLRDKDRRVCVLEAVLWSCRPPCSPILRLNSSTHCCRPYPPSQPPKVSLPHHLPQSDILPSALHTSQEPDQLICAEVLMTNNDVICCPLN